MNQILKYYDKILSRNFISAASYFEWNTFRIFKQLDDFINLSPNFKLSSEGIPLACAKPGVEDFHIQYESFYLLIECSLRSGETQVDYEGESVIRHLHSKICSSKMSCFSIFLSPSININSYKYFSFNKILTPVIPLNLNQFRNLIESIHENYSSSLMNKIVKDIVFEKLTYQDAHLWSQYIDNYIKNISNI